MSPLGPTRGVDYGYGLSPQRPKVQRGAGLRVRLRAIEEVTPKGIIDQPLHLQLPSLDDWTIEEEASWTDYQTLTGEYSRSVGVAGRQLRRTTFSTMVMTDPRPWLVNPQTDAWEQIEALEQLMRRRTPFELLVVSSYASSTRRFQEYRELQRELGRVFDDDHPFSIELNMDATIRSMGRVLKHGENDTRYLDVAMVEHREARLPRRFHFRPPHPLPYKHPIRQGTTLAKLSKAYYGTATDWKRIARVNKYLSSWGANTPLFKSKYYRAGAGTPYKGRDRGQSYVLIPKP